MQNKGKSDGGAGLVLGVYATERSTVIAVEPLDRSPPINIEPGIVKTLPPNADLSNYTLFVNTDDGTCQMFTNDRTLSESWVPWLTFELDSAHDNIFITKPATAQGVGQRAKAYAGT